MSTNKPCKETLSLVVSPFLHFILCTGRGMIEMTYEKGFSYMRHCLKLTSVRKPSMKQNVRYYNSRRKVYRPGLYKTSQKQCSDFHDRSTDDSSTHPSPKTISLDFMHFRFLVVTWLKRYILPLGNVVHVFLN